MCPGCIDDLRNVSIVSCRVQKTTIKQHLAFSLKSIKSSSIEHLTFYVSRLTKASLMATYILFYCIFYFNCIPLSIASLCILSIVRPHI